MMYNLKEATLQKGQDNRSGMIMCILMKNEEENIYEAKGMPTCSSLDQVCMMRLSILDSHI